MRRRARSSASNAALYSSHTGYGTHADVLSSYRTEPPGRFSKKGHAPLNHSPNDHRLRAAMTEKPGDHMPAWLSPSSATRRAPSGSPNRSHGAMGVVRSSGAKQYCTVPGSALNAGSGVQAHRPASTVYGT